MKTRGSFRPRHGDCVGGRVSSENHTWQQMRRRCQNPTHPRYADYGGRGIGVCERWASFENFLADMGRRPSPTHTLDRINNDGNYEPSNCRWATKREQTLNSRHARMIEFNGRTQCMTDWAAEIGLKTTTLWQRLNLGWPVERALTEPKRRW